MATEFKLSYTANQIDSKLQQIDSKANISDIPTKVSELDNDRGYITSAPVTSVNGKTGDVTVSVPTKVSQLTNDINYITSYTETDPTVPAWAKKSTKPSYTASEVGALPNTTVIPTKVSELTNDAGYLTQHQSLAEYAKTADLGDLATKDSVEKTDLATAVQTSLSKADSALQSFTETDPTVPAWAKEATKPSYSKSEVGLGNVDNVKQYSASNPPPYPVTKVNNKTGAVTLTASDVGADASGTANSSVSTHNTNTSAHADIREAINQLSSEKVDKNNVSLGIASDGLIYIFVNGAPMGTGIPQSQSGDVFGYVDENNTIVLNGNLADGTYTLKYEMDNGKVVNVGNMVLDHTVYYTVTNTLTQCTNNNKATQVAEGSGYSATITANSSYALSSIKVTMGGTDITSTAVSGNTINIANVTGKIIITAVAVVASYTITNTLTKCTSNNSATSAANGGSYSATITANSGYAMSSIKVTMGGTDITSSAVSGNKITIASVTGNVVITATATAIPTYTITNNLTYCTNSNSATSIQQGSAYSATITANNGYELKSVTATMGGSAVSVTNGKINIASVTGNIVITAVAEVVKTETNFAVYNESNTSDWSIWINNARIGSDGAYRQDTYDDSYGTPAVSNWIEVQNGDLIEYQGMYITNKSSGGYKSDKTVVASGAIGSLSCVKDHTTPKAGQGSFVINNANVKYFRIGGYINAAYGDIVIKIKRNGEYL